MNANLIFSLLKNDYVEENEFNKELRLFSYYDREFVYFNGKPFFDYLLNIENLKKEDLKKIFYFIKSQSLLLPIEYERKYYRYYDANDNCYHYDYNHDDNGFPYSYDTTCESDDALFFFDAIEMELDYRLNEKKDKLNLKEMFLIHDIYEMVNLDKAHKVRKMFISLL